MQFKGIKIINVKDLKKSKIVWIKDMKMIHKLAHNKKKRIMNKRMNRSFYSKSNSKIIF